MMVAEFAALSGATPDRVLVDPSRESQQGALDRVYSRGEPPENVDAEKVNVNGTETRATGGTCEFIGSVIVGAAIARAANRCTEHTALTMMDEDVGQTSPTIKLEPILGGGKAFEPGSCERRRCSIKTQDIYRVRNYKPSLEEQAP
jgi:hypothetical protein